jgi:hypothetical protein
MDFECQCLYINKKTLEANRKVAATHPPLRLSAATATKRDPKAENREKT